PEASMNIMNIHRLGAALIPLTVMISCGAAAIADEAHKVISPDTTKWGPAPPSLPKGAEAAVLFGDPGKSGRFTLRLKLPAGYAIPAHQHPTYEAVTLISGRFNVGMGDKLSEAGAQTMVPGA